MRIPRVQFTIRRVMVAVAVVAFLIAATQSALFFDRRLRYCQRQAILHWYTGERHQQMGESLEVKARAMERKNPTVRVDRQGVFDEFRQAAHDREIKAQYERAMWRPWLRLPVEPAHLKP